jgi:hypothetical protein
MPLKIYIFFQYSVKEKIFININKIFLKYVSRKIWIQYYIHVTKDDWLAVVKILW